MLKFALRRGAALLAPVLLFGLSACGVFPVSPAPADTSAAPASHALAENGKPAFAPDLPSQPFYYSTTVDMRNGEFNFLYGLERNKVANAQDSHFDESGLSASPAIPADVFACRLNTGYHSTFAGHGLLAGAQYLHETKEIAVDVSGDAGQSWRRALLPPVGALVTRSWYFRFGFTSPGEGWLAALSEGTGGTDNVMLFSTADAGATWEQTAAYSAPGAVSDVLFITAQHAYMGVDGAGGSQIMETRDGGVSWQPCSVSLPLGFSGAESGGYGVEFLRSEQGLYCTFSAVLGRESARAFELLALTPHEENGGTAWRSDLPWVFVQNTSQITFFSYLNTHIFEPGFHGTYQEGQEEHIDHQFLHYAAWYAQQYKPEVMTETPGEYGSDYVLPRKLVADLMTLVYNAADFDVAVLAEYRADLDGFTLPVSCGHGLAYQDAVIHSVNAFPNSDIEIIRDVRILREGGYGGRSEVTRTHVQRCVFRHAVSASGAEMFTLIECETLGNYPNAAR